MIQRVKEIKEPLTLPPSPSNSSDESSEAEELLVPTAKWRKALYCFLTHCITVFYLCIYIHYRERNPAFDDNESAILGYLFLKLKKNMLKFRSLSVTIELNCSLLITLSW